MTPKAFLSFLLLTQISFGQNLIPNSSFEEITKCPQSFTTSPHKLVLKEWISPNNGTPDVFAKCGWPDVGVPNNHAGKEYPISGDNYVGLYSGALSPRLRNYIEYLFTSTIVTINPGKTFFFSFFLSNASISRAVYDSVNIALFDKEYRFEHDSTIWVDNQFITILKKGYQYEGWTNYYGTIRVDKRFTHIGIGNFMGKQALSRLWEDRQKGSAFIFFDHLYLFESKTCGDSETDFFNLFSCSSEELDNIPMENLSSDLQNILFALPHSKIEVNLTAFKPEDRDYLTKWWNEKANNPIIGNRLIMKGSDNSLMPIRNAKGKAPLMLHTPLL